MGRGATTPEELEMLLEDAVVVRDAGALVALFEDGAVLASCLGPSEARGPRAIAGRAATLWGHDRVFVADPRRVVQACELALVVGEGSVSVARRAAGCGWRYVISLLGVDITIPKEET